MKCILITYLYIFPLFISVVKFYGISTTSAGVTVIPFQNQIKAKKSVHLEFVGASDTAGYCVDGTPNTNLIDGFLNGWKYGNCDYGLPGSLTQLLQEDEDQNTGNNFQYTYRSRSCLKLQLKANCRL